MRVSGVAGEVLTQGDERTLVMVRMPWGKFRGYPLEDIESSYLVWVLESCERARPELVGAILRELQTRFGSPPPPPPSSSSVRKTCPDPALAAQLISTGLRVLAQKFHPDKGGDTATMQKLNAVAAWLRLVVPQ